MPVSNAAHNGFLLLVQLIYGILVNAVHGNLVFLVLYQVNDAPVTTAVAPTTIADVIAMIGTYGGAKLGGGGSFQNSCSHPFLNLKLF